MRSPLILPSRMATIAIDFLGQEGDRVTMTMVTPVSRLMARSISRMAAAPVLASTESSAHPPAKFGPVDRAMATAMLLLAAGKLC